MLVNQLLHQCHRCAQMAASRLLVELASSKTLAKHPAAFASALLLISQLSGLATAVAARIEGQLSMPEKFDEDDEVGTGLYVLIGCAAVTVVLMYSWIGYTLYQGFKARRKVD